MLCCVWFHLKLTQYYQFYGTKCWNITSTVTESLCCLAIHYGASVGAPNIVYYEPILFSRDLIQSQYKLTVLQDTLIFTKSLLF